MRKMFLVYRLVGYVGSGLPDVRTPLTMVEAEDEYVAAEKWCRANPDEVQRGLVLAQVVRASPLPDLYVPPPSAEARP